MVKLEEIWSGNITLKMEGNEDTFSPGVMEVERYSDAGVALRFTSKDERAKAIIRFSPQECKTLIKKLLDSLK